ncbi:MAG: hypothetical protein AABY14_01865 [Nanoarchaeota archaeon]
MRYKKAQESLGLSYRTIISLVLIVEVILGLMLFIFSVKSGVRFEQHFLARDIATLIDTITISPNNLIIDYPKDTNNLAINIEKERVIVYKPPKYTSVPETYPFSEDKNIEYTYTELLPTEQNGIRPRFMKQGDKINIIGEKYFLKSIEKPICRLPKDKDSLKSKGKLIDVIIEDRDELSILESQEFISKANKADVVVIITKGDDVDETINPINAYIHLDSKNAEKSKYLSCLIINKILDNQKLNSLISEKNLKEFTNQKILLTEKFNLNLNGLVILLEIGNKKIPSSSNILNDEEFTDIVKDSINQAIDSYG